MFLLDKTMPNGALGRFHKAVKMELREDGIHAILNSYHAAEMTVISWQDEYLIPPPFSAEDLEQVEALLVLPGAPFDGGVPVPAEIATLEQAQARRWGEVKAKRAALEQQGVAPTPFGDVQCDDGSKIKISGLVQMAMIAAQAGAPFSQAFTLADNSDVTLDGAEMVQLGVAVGQYVSALHAHAQALRAAVEGADTIGVVAEIDIDTGWP